jgi:signal transduction histidine kinase
MAQELDSTEMLRSDFINNFSHEFKTPIVSIVGFAKLLKRGNLTESQKKEYIDIIEEESLRLSAMATNVLNLTKFENQSILSNVTEFNLSEQLRNSILELEGKWTKKHIEFNIDFDEHRIMGNKDMLKQVWLNLIDNAVKFSPEYGTVEVSVADMDKTLSVSVLNYGVEIPIEQREKIFKKFYQADESHTSEGNGIGLAIVKNVTDLHGGTVMVDSENETTKFTVELPKIQREE